MYIGQELSRRSDSMAKVRRSPEDYSEEVMRFERWLLMSSGKTIGDVRDIDELVSELEKWIRSIDVYGVAMARLSKQMLYLMLSRNIIPEREKEVPIIRDFRVNRSRQKWIRWEDRQLIRLYRKPVTAEYIARELGRSRSSIYHRVRKLGLKRSKRLLRIIRKRSLERRKKKAMS